MAGRRTNELVARKAMFAVTLLTALIAPFMVLGLIERSALILRTIPLRDLLFSGSWNPVQGEFGFAPFIVGTVWVTGLAMVLAVPPSLLMAIYLAEYASKKTRSIIKPLVDVLAGTPSVVCGLWGVLLIVPIIRNYLAPLAGISTTGYSVLAGGLVLAIMVCPIIVSITDEVIRAVPNAIKEASLAVGATKWQTVKHVVMRSAFSGIIAAIILGFGRAFGETMAVLMVVGNVPTIPRSLFDPAYPIPALIANDYGEMLTTPSYESALMFAALLLILIVFAFSIVAAVLLRGIRRRYALGQKT
ncbi:MAG: phosphate ABC transporter permease subunit PstC [Candidatus Bathyarchaeia archaeon]|jgi:phosphate transport system permease protein